MTTCSTSHSVLPGSASRHDPGKYAQSDCIPGQDGTWKYRDHWNTAARRAVRTLPVVLLPEGRLCLVVGGGKVAARKAETLLDAGARVTLVAPAISDHLEILQRERDLHVAHREYTPGDLDAGPFIVIAATDNHILNRNIIDDCHSRGILCACPDTGWQAGDFISPASFRHGDLTVSVSTGGISCRRSRLVRESLARHINAAASVELMIIGTDHRVAEMTRIEQIYPDREMADGMARMLAQLRGMHEFMPLCTCNRIEVACIAAPGRDLERAAARIMGLDGLDGKFYVHRGVEAFRHLARVAAGMLSQMPGETNIRSQIKTALEKSRSCGWSGSIILNWVGRILHVAKAVRHCTAGFCSRADIPEACLALINDHFGRTAGLNALVTGSGAMGTAIIKTFAGAGMAVSCCYNSKPPVLDPGHPHGISVYPLAALDDAIPGMDVVVGCAGGRNHILGARHAGILSAHPRPLVLDLGMPRNTEPGFADGHGNIRLAGLDDLRALHAGKHPDTALFLEKAESVIGDHMDEYEQLIQGLENSMQG